MAVTNRRFTVVEQAGYIGEKDIKSFPRWPDAQAYIDKNYSADEMDSESKNCLHVEIRQDWTEEDGDHKEYVY